MFLSLLKAKMLASAATPTPFFPLKFPNAQHSLPNFNTHLEVIPVRTRTKTKLSNPKPTLIFSYITKHHQYHCLNLISCSNRSVITRVSSDGGGGGGGAVDATPQHSKSPVCSSKLKLPSFNLGFHAISYLHVVFVCGCVRICHDNFCSSSVSFPVLVLLSCCLSYCC